jgi:non-ribosomal peptide synthetase component E (peptide arylation enzyme)
MTTVGPYKYVEDNARLRPNDPAVIHGPTKISFVKLHEMASRLGTAMRLEGVRPGSVVLIRAGMPLWDYLFCIAVLHEGAIAAVQTVP